MPEEKAASYPMMPIAHWWALRERFQNSIPGVVTANYVASALNMKESSARANVIPPLRIVGIIDDEGKPTERARLWRDDHEYTKVCKQILTEVYPSELKDACQSPTEDRSCVERWFANHTGSGKIAVGKMAVLYILLNEADATKAKTSSVKNTKTKAPKERLANKPSPPKVAAIPPKKSDSSEKQDAKNPSIHLNLEIHISADASPDQIDKIFESMARHIYDKK